MDLLVNPDLVTLFSQLVLAVFLGMLLGTERSIAGKTAGMRTYALVSLGSALFIITSTIATGVYLPLLNFDTLRVAGGIVTGVGFLGAGMIIFRGSRVSGLTTAASLWVAAGIGMAVGFRLYAVAIFTTLLTLLVFTILWAIEQKIKSFKYYEEDDTEVEAVVNDRD